MTGGRQTAECLNDYFSSFKAISCPPLTCQSLTLIEMSNFIDYENTAPSTPFQAQIMPETWANIAAADETKIFGIETETRFLSGRDSRLSPESLRSRD